MPQYTDWGLKPWFRFNAGMLPRLDNNAKYKAILLSLSKTLGKLFFKLNWIGTCSWLSNQIPFILVPQETAKLPEVKGRGLKKICSSAQSTPCKSSPILSPGSFFVPLNLISSSFAAPWLALSNKDAYYLIQRSWRRTNRI